jgi:putative transposase
MKKSKFTEAQILKVLKTQELGKKVSEICREYGISEPTFYNWKSRYGGMTLSDRVKELESENARLKRLVADSSLDNQVLKEINSNKW